MGQDPGHNTEGLETAGCRLRAVDSHTCPIQIRNPRPRGVTLVELVIAVSMMVVVVAMMAPVLHGVQSSWRTKEGNSESLAQARAFMHHLHRQLSQAVRITAVSDSETSQGHIQFVTCDDVEARYEIGATDDIQFGPVGSLVDLAGPVETMRFTCYDGNDFSTPTTDANSIRVVTVEATFRNPNTSGRDHTFSTSVYLRAGAIADEQLGAVDPGVAMKQQIDWAGADAVIDSYRFSQGAYDPASSGSEAVISVNTNGQDVIVLSAGALLRGGACVGPGGDPATGISITGGAQVTRTKGTLVQTVDIPDVSAPTGSPFDGSPEGDFLYSAGTRVINSNRHFNRMSLTGTATVIISQNVTILVDDEFRLENTARMRLQPPVSLSLYVRNDVTLKDSATFNSLIQDPGYAHLYIIGSDKMLRIEDSAQMWAVVQNPNGDVEITDSAQLYGKVKAGQLTGGGKIHVDLDATFE
jgi:type II secretory pathway pseudopilin PulG